jgi:bacteriocin-like protein
MFRELTESELEAVSGGRGYYKKSGDTNIALNITGGHEVKDNNIVASAGDNNTVIVGSFVL